MKKRCENLRNILVLITLICLGCGESTPSGTVSGKITLEGEPVAAGNEIFFEQRSRGLIAAGVVEEEGRYSLNYNGSHRIPLGDYVVFVGAPESNMSEKEFYELKRKVDAEFRSRGENPPLSPDWTLPAQYYQSNTSPLRETVQQGENTIDIELTTE